MGQEADQSSERFGRVGLTRRTNGPDSRQPRNAFSRAQPVIQSWRSRAGAGRCRAIERVIESEVPGMPWPTVRRVLRWLVVAVAALVASGLIMRAARFNVRLGQPPEFGGTAYPMLVVAHGAEPGATLPPGTLDPRRSRDIMLGTLVTWADGTRTLYIHR